MGDHPPQMPPLREMVGDGLRLRPLVQFDEALYCVVYTDLDLMRQVAEVLTMPAAQRAFALALKANADPHSRARYWVIEALDADVGLLGIVATPAAETELQCEVGAMVLAAWQNRGLAAKAIALLADHVFSASTVARLHTRHAGNNGSASGLMHKLGFAALTADADTALGFRWELTRRQWQQRGAGLGQGWDPPRRLSATRRDRRGVPGPGHQLAGHRGGVRRRTEGTGGAGGAQPRPVPEHALRCGEMGSLRGFVRIIAAREVVALARRADARTRRSEPDLEELVNDSDPELLSLKARYGEEFKAAFEMAIAQLEPRQRNLLRHQLIDDLGIDAIGALYGVHRATAARWLARAREDLFDGTVTELSQRLSLPAPEIQSVIRIIGSQLDASVTRLLGSQDG